MDQRLRIATAATVMLVGLGLALCFRRTAGQGEIPFPAHSDTLVLRKQPDVSGPASVGPVPANPTAANPQVAAAEPAKQPAPVVLSPAESPAAPPKFANTYPNATPPVTSRWGVSLGEVAAEAAPATPATHKVADGDSLAQLAERYLGSAQRAIEIFEANRTVLSDPQLLPIGAELKIPRP